MSSPRLVDDADPAVDYSKSPAWIFTDGFLFEVDETRHGAPSSGMTASLKFIGTGVQVIGTLEPSATNGQPTTQYSIDGQVIATYTAPFTTDTHLNTTFFSKRDLPQGDHTLVVENMNGTSPTLFWLDFFLVDESPAPSSSEGSPAPISTSSSQQAPPPTTAPSPTTSAHSDTAVPSQNTSSTSSTSPGAGTLTAPGTSTTTDSAGSTSGTGTSLHPASSSALPSFSAGTRSGSTEPSQVTFSNSGSAAGNTAVPTTLAAQSSQSVSRTNVAAIVGAVVGGLVLTTLFIIFCLIWRRRRRSSDDFRPVVFETRKEHEHHVSVKSAEALLVSAPGLHVQPMAPSEASASTLSDTPSHIHPNLVVRNRSTTTPLSASDTKLQESLYGHSSTNRSANRSRTLQRPPQISSGGSTLVPMSEMSSDARSTPTAAEDVVHAPWYAARQQQSRAEQLLGSLSSRRHQQPERRPQDVDSGLRTYDEAMLPPPYTPG